MPNKLALCGSTKEAAKRIFRRKFPAPVCVFSTFSSFSSSSFYFIHFASMWLILFIWEWNGWITFIARKIWGKFVLCGIIEWDNYAFYHFLSSFFFANSMLEFDRVNGVDAIFCVFYSNLNLERRVIHACFFFSYEWMQNKYIIWIENSSEIRQFHLICDRYAVSVSNCRNNWIGQYWTYISVFITYRG